MKPRRQRLKDRLLRLGAGLLVGIAVVWWLLPWAVPLPAKLRQPTRPSPVFLAADGTPLRQLLDDEGQRAAPVTGLDAIPPMLVRATLAAEDKRFFEHHGIDLAAAARALWDDALHRRIVSGASTITQQLAKVCAEERNPRTLFVKVVEALQARRIEMSFSKERILTEYLNRIGYGNLLSGCASASLGYFDKPLRDLTPAECAFLAALPQSPTRLNPYRHPDAARKRQQLILDQMHRQGWLNEEAHTLALREKPKLQSTMDGFAAPHAVALAATSSAEAVVQTTVDRSLQSRVEAAIHHRLELLGPKHVSQAAAVVIENRSGRVLALVGSRSFAGSSDGQINGAWTPHSPGSAIKPFTYLLALQNGFTAASVIPDLPVEYSTPSGLYRPENYDHRHYGPVTVRTALGSSLNIPAVRVLQRLGGESVLVQSLQSLGLTTLDQSPQHYGLGLTIGNAPVRLVELANAYACIARLGDYLPWTLLRSAEPTPAQRLLPASACFIIADILSDNQARALTFGPHSVIRMPFRCAVKTGTSTGYRDNWTVGFTPEFTVAVWVGNFDNTPMNRVSGVTGAGPIFRDIFTALAEDHAPSWFQVPAGLTRCRIDPRNGKRLSADSPAIANTREEWFLQGAQPPLATASDYDAATGRAYLSPEYADWLARGESWLSGTVCLRESDTGSPLRLICPLDGSVFQLDPELPDGGRRLLLRAQGGSDPRWSSPTLPITTDRGLSHAMLTPGSHEITVTSSETGDSRSAHIVVKPPPTSAETLARTSEHRDLPAR